MSIDFLSIGQVRDPGQYAEIDSSRASAGAAGLARILLVGGRLSTATVAADTPVRTGTASQAVTQHGRGSMLAQMVAAFRKVWRLADIWTIGIADDGGATAATKTITVTGTATAAGTIELDVAGKRYSIAVASGDANTAIATAIDTAISADEADQPCTSGVATNVVTLTLRHGGPQGNDLDVRHSVRQGAALPAGVTLAIAAGVTGATAPSLTAAISAIATVDYAAIVSGFSDSTSLDALAADIADRWQPDRQQRTHGWAALRGTFSAVNTILDARNDAELTVVDAATPQSITWEWSAAMAAAYLRQLTGSQPTKGLSGVEVPGLIPPPEGERRTHAERNTGLYAGGATYTVGATDKVLTGRAITVYQTSPAGQPSVAFLDSNTRYTLRLILSEQQSKIGADYKNATIMDDTTLQATPVKPGVKVVSPQMIKDTLVGLYRDQAARALVRDPEGYAESMVVAINAEPGRIDVQQEPVLALPYYVGAMQVRFRLDGEDT